MEHKNKERLLLGVYKYLDNKGFENFLAQVKELQTPKSIAEKQSGASYIPDLTATKDGTLCIFELVSGEANQEKTEQWIKRWRALNQHASSQEGKFYLIVHVDQFEEIIAIINKHNLERIGIMQFESN
ncbi:MAG: hypothetical protein V2I47_05415 [Bacteroidales bacterium]|jgi:hypothetical protein|nr:hypothetical protein [Bacteroidales bacterium]